MSGSKSGPRLPTSEGQWSDETLDAQHYNKRYVPVKARPSLRTLIVVYWLCLRSDCSHVTYEGRLTEPALEKVARRAASRHVGERVSAIIVEPVETTGDRVPAVMAGT